jgi:cysteine synthase B
MLQTVYTEERQKMFQLVQYVDSDEHSLFDMVGNTPVVELKRISAGINGVSVFAKAEYVNPSGSVKDRAARAMILHGIRSGQLTKDKIILDSTSGNTGIAYAMFGAALGYKVKLLMPSNASAERKKVIRAYGAEIIETDPLEGSDGAYRAVIEMAKSEPEKYFFPNQYDNMENVQAHYETTGVELYEQCKPTHFVAGTGTSGTFTGISKRLKEYDSAIQIVLMQPDSPFHGLEGMKHMGATIKPKIFNESLADMQVTVKTEEAYKTVHRLAAEEGLFVGISSGANVYAALELAKTLPHGSRIATILCDNGYRYMTEPLWRDI